MSEYIIDWDENLVIDTFSKNSLREEIVRCRECKCYQPKEGAILSCKFEYRGFTQWKLAEPNGFCKWGERSHDDVSCEHLERRQP